MKKLITLLMSFVLIFSLVGCGSTSETTETKTYTEYVSYGKENQHLEKCEFVDSEYNIDNKARMTYKVVCADTAYDAAVDGALSVVHPASQLEEDRYKLLFNVLNYLRR